MCVKTRFLGVQFSHGSLWRDKGRYRVGGKVRGRFFGGCFHQVKGKGSFFPIPSSPPFKDIFPLFRGPRKRQQVHYPSI